MLIPVANEFFPYSINQIDRQPNKGIQQIYRYKHFSKPSTGFCDKDDQQGDQHKCNGKDDIESEIIQIITIVHATNGDPVKTFKQL
ncbi:hypothetical protein AA98_1269 [Escherichia coli 2-011-08_S1_C1]|nr:hypothetical protein AA98_1269 [Escherichia coli 2-011-08_S1_C1]BDI50600.1 hypothetical protein EsCd1KSP079_01474 [Escherichia sp. KS167_9B]BED44064.1 hypothetical protein VEE63_02420 [Escherichia coli]